MCLVITSYSTTVQISGRVTQYGFPVSQLQVDFSTPGNPSSVFTDSLGFYNHSINAPIDSGQIQVSIRDCNRQVLSQNLAYDTITNRFLGVDFSFCSDSLIYVSGCMSDIAGPAQQRVIHYSLDRNFNQSDSIFTDLFGMFQFNLSSSNILSGFMHYSFTDCNNQLQSDSAYFDLGDSLQLNLSYCAPNAFGASGSLQINGFQSLDGYQIQAISLDASSQQLVLKDQAFVDSMGNYYFDSLEAGNYIFKFLPPIGADVRSHAAPVYLGGNLFWDKAQVTNFSPGDTLPSQSLSLVQNIPSANSIEGSVAIDPSINPQLARAPVLLLKQSDSSLVSFATQDQQGNFQFSNAPIGDFLVYLDYPGLPTEAIALSVAQNSGVLDAQIRVNPAGVSSDLFIGIEENREANAPYPNPFKNQFKLDKYESWRARGSNDSRGEPELLILLNLLPTHQLQTLCHLHLLGRKDFQYDPEDYQAKLK